MVAWAGVSLISRGKRWEDRDGCTVYQYSKSVTLLRIILLGCIFSIRRF